MKMKAGTRVIMTILLVAIILLCAFILASSFGLINALYLKGATETILNGGILYKVLYAVIFVVIIIVCFIIMFFGIRKETPKTAKIAVFDSGSIMITVKAIEELVERYVRNTKEVKELHSKVVSFSDYIDIIIQIGVQPDSNIPEITKALQTGLAEEITTHTGIEVKHTKITVMQIDDRHKNVSA